MSRNSYRQGVDDALRIGEPNQREYKIDPDYTEGFDGYMKEHPILSIQKLKEEKIRAEVGRDFLKE